MASASPLGRLSSFTDAPGRSGFERLQNSPFGSGSLTAGLSQNIQASGGLGNTRPTPVGRSMRDPSRALEMQARGTARPGQVEAAFGLDQLRRQGEMDQGVNQLRGQMEQKALEDAMNRIMGPTTPGMPVTDSIVRGAAAPQNRVPFRPGAAPAMSLMGGIAPSATPMQTTMDGYSNPFGLSATRLFT